MLFKIFDENGHIKEVNIKLTENEPETENTNKTEISETENTDIKFGGRRGKWKFYHFSENKKSPETH